MVRQCRGRNAVAGFVFLLATFAVGVGPARATHFRGEAMSWVLDPTYVSATDVRVIVTVDSTWRWDYTEFNFPSVGQSLSTVDPSISFSGTGVSQSVSPGMQVVSVDPVADLFRGRSVFGMVFPRTGFPITVENVSGNRLSTLAEGNHDVSWRVGMVIPGPPGAGKPQQSPAFTVPLPQTVHLAPNSPASIILPTSAPAGLANAVVFTPAAASYLNQSRPMAIPACAYDFTTFSGGCPVCNDSYVGQCAGGMTISPQGILDWTPALPGRYAVQLTVNSLDGNLVTQAQAPLEMIFEVHAPVGSSPSQCFYADCSALVFPSVAVQPAYTVVVGTPLSIPVTATSSEGSLYLTTTALPDGATLGPVAGSSPLNATLSWTPVPTDQGTHQVCFQAITTTGHPSGVQCTTITVTPGALCIAGWISATGGPPCTECPAGSFADAPGRTSCTPCPVGSFADAPGEVSCTPCTSLSCSPSSVYHTACTKTADNTCGPCDPSCTSHICTGPAASDCIAVGSECDFGQYSATGAQPCTICPAGTANPYRAQTTCTPCAPGTFSFARAPACDPCPSGTFADAEGQGACTPCTTSCAAGEYLSGSCTATGNATCTACDPSCVSCSGPTAADCTSRPMCAPGTFSANGQEPCSPCPTGSFATGAGQTSCTPCAAGCAADQYQSASCTPTSDASCGACDASCLTCTGPGAADCTSRRMCAPGTFSATGEEPCTPCTSGCADDEYQAALCTATSDATCAACDPSCASCSGAGASSCTSCATGVAPTGGQCLPSCTTAPASGCRLPAVGGKSKLAIKDSTDDTKDQLQWTWAKGSATTVADFGNPVTTNGYFLCVYDAGLLVSSTSLPAGGTCAGKPCWAAKSSGFLYMDKDLTPDGALGAKLASGVAGKASASVSGKGANLETPDPTAFTGPVTVQFQRADGGICFESVFSAPFKKNAGGTFLDVDDTTTTTSSTTTTTTTSTSSTTTTSTTTTTTVTTTSTTTTTTTTTTSTTTTTLATSCKALQLVQPTAPSGVYSIDPGGVPAFSAYCDMTIDGGGWTVIQRRTSDSDFYRTWAEYAAGFGSVSANHWLGLDRIHALTATGTHELRVDLNDFTVDGYGKWASFSVGAAATNYTLSVGTMTAGTIGDSLAPHNGNPFTTKDVDNDTAPFNCAQAYVGAWWYGYCFNANLNGPYVAAPGTHDYGLGIDWYAWRGYYQSMASTQMMVR